MRENSKRQHPASLHASGEDYLEAILILHMKKGTVRSVDVARHLGVSKPSVCHAVALLKDGGFLTMDEGLTPRWRKPTPAGLSTSSARSLLSG